MAEEKITIVDLRKAIAKQTGMPEAQVGSFLTNLLSAITEGLRTDQSVKVGGLGTFKLQWVEPRKSVNISTGEDIIIEGYNKLSFSPEASVKARVNEPFASLEAVELDADGNPIEPTEKQKPFSQIDKFGEQAEEIRGLLSDLGADLGGLAAMEEAVTEDAAIEEKPVVVEEEPAAEETKVEEAAAVEEPVAVEEAEAVEEEPVEEEPVVAEETKEEEAAAVEETKVEEPAVKEQDTKKPFRPWLVAMITILVFAALLVVAYFFMQNKIMVWAEQLNGKIDSKKELVVKETPHKDNVVITKATPVTTIVHPEEEVAEEEAVTTEAKAEEVKTDGRLPQSVVNYLTNERVYTKFQAQETVAEGSRLAWISRKRYGRKDFWVFIYEANRDKLKTPESVVAGMVLNIPELPNELLTADQEAVEEYTLALKNKYLGM